MLANPGGQERTDAEYGALLQRAGFKLQRGRAVCHPVRLGGFAIMAPDGKLVATARGTFTW